MYNYIHRVERMQDIWRGQSFTVYLKHGHFFFFTGKAAGSIIVNSRISFVGTKGIQKKEGAENPAQMLELL